MKTITTIAIGAVAGILVLARPITRDEMHWRYAFSQNKAVDYKGYLTSWPTGRHSREAEIAYDEREWKNASATNTLGSYSVYEQTHSRGKHVDEARRLIELSHWSSSTNKNSVVGYQQYLGNYAKGAFAEEARLRIENLTWQQASSSNSIVSYNAYLSNYVNGRFAADARVQVEALAWKEACNANTHLSYQKYLSSFNNGRYAEEARNELDNVAWRHANSAGSAEHYESCEKAIMALESYMQQYPTGRHSNEAALRIDSLARQEARNEGPVALADFMRRYPNGRYAGVAPARAEELAWKKAIKSNTIAGIRAYTAAYPNARFGQEAQTRFEALRIDEAPFREASQAGTKEALEAFVQNFPGHVSEGEARGVLKDIPAGREAGDIVELLRKRKIEVETSGGGIEHVAVRVRRLVPYAIRVLVPVGTYFEAKQSAQNMVTTAESEVTLSSGGWVSASVSAACANRSRPIPYGSDAFTVQMLASQSELVRLVRVLDGGVQSFGVKQAAVWIVTDDATFEDLGILVSRPFGSMRGGSRMITEADAASAMKACEQAGIDITKKRIWTDKATILRGVLDGGTRAWLEGK